MGTRRFTSSTLVRWFADDTLPAFKLVYGQAAALCAEMSAFSAPEAVKNVKVVEVADVEGAAPAGGASGVALEYDKLKSQLAAGVRKGCGLWQRRAHLGPCFLFRAFPCVSWLRRTC